MTPKKTLHEREKELRLLLATSAGPGGTPRLGVPLSRRERQAETGENVRRHIHLGPREGTGAD